MMESIATGLSPEQLESLPHTPEVRALIETCVEYRRRYMKIPDKFLQGMNGRDRFPQWHEAATRLEGLAGTTVTPAKGGWLASVRTPLLSGGLFVWEGWFATQSQAAWNATFVRETEWANQ